MTRKIWANVVAFAFLMCLFTPGFAASYVTLATYSGGDCKGDITSADYFPLDICTDSYEVKYSTVYKLESKVLVQYLFSGKGCSGNFTTIPLGTTIGHCSNVGKMSIMSIEGKIELTRPYMYLVVYNLQNCSIENLYYSARLSVCMYPGAIYTANADGVDYKIYEEEDCSGDVKQEHEFKLHNCLGGTELTEIVV